MRPPPSEPPRHVRVLPADEEPARMDPWEEGFDWQFTNYTILWFAGIGLIFGGWWFVSARKWFKGPIRMGTEEELDRIEERYDRPAGGAAPAGQ